MNKVAWGNRDTSLDFQDRFSFQQIIFHCISQSHFIGGESSTAYFANMLIEKMRSHYHLPSGLLEAETDRDSGALDPLGGMLFGKQQREEETARRGIQQGRGVSQRLASAWCPWVHYRGGLTWRQGSQPGVPQY